MSNAPDAALDPWSGGLPRRVRVVEVGPRDGFQSVDIIPPTPDKVWLVNHLLPLGFERVEVTAFVHPQAIPQLADAEAVMGATARGPAERMVLVPNVRGVERALPFQPDMLNFVLSASESHNLANVRRTVDQSFDDLALALELAHEAEVPMRMTLATAFGCPYEGVVPEQRVLDCCRRAAALGASEICLGDTTGMANPRQLHGLFRQLSDIIPPQQQAVHLHNTRGTGGANLLAALQAGVTRFDAAIGGMGGCPYAPGATGNVCTEDMVNMLADMGIETGVQLDPLVTTARQLEERLGLHLPGQVIRAGTTLTRTALPAAAG